MNGDFRESLEVFHHSSELICTISIALSKPETQSRVFISSSKRYNPISRNIKLEIAMNSDKLLQSLSSENTS
jgi:hypothetical protein